MRKRGELALFIWVISIAGWLATSQKYAPSLR